jgi:hypothetical protein
MNIINTTGSVSPKSASNSPLTYPIGYSRLSPGDLVQIMTNNQIVGLAEDIDKLGVVINWFDSDLYSSASASVMVAGQVYTYDARNLGLMSS